MAEDSAFRDATMRKDYEAAHEDDCVPEDEPCAQLHVNSWNDEPPRRTPSNAVEHALAGALNWRSKDIIVAGGEIGLWMCLAFGLEVAGVQLTSATKAAFLNQVSVLITPLLVHLSGEHVRGLEWLACALGLLGSGLVAADSLLSGSADVMEGGGTAAAGTSNEVRGENQVEHHCCVGHCYGTLAWCGGVV